MYKPDQERMRLFWTALQDVWLKLYGSSFPTAAAINVSQAAAQQRIFLEQFKIYFYQGHAPAGGCLLALCCEYRVMCPKYTIGLNETRLGIVAPEFFMATMRNVLSRRQAEKALTLGTMFTTDEALNVIFSFYKGPSIRINFFLFTQIGLIDEVAADKEEAVAKCEAFLGEFRKIAPQARSLTKQMLRKAELIALSENRKQDTELFAYAVNQKKTQAGLEAYMQSLKKKQSCEYSQLLLL